MGPQGITNRQLDERLNELHGLRTEQPTQQCIDIGVCIGCFK